MPSLCLLLLPYHRQVRPFREETVREVVFGRQMVKYHKYSWCAWRIVFPLIAFSCYAPSRGLCEGVANDFCHQQKHKFHSPKYRRKPSFPGGRSSDRVECLFSSVTFVSFFFSVFVSVEIYLHGFMVLRPADRHCTYLRPKLFRPSA